MIGKNMTAINFVIQKELNAQAEAKAKELNISRNALMRMAISKFLKEER